MLFYSMNGHCRLHSSALHTYICHLKIRASSLQFRASKINMALVRMDKLVKKLMSNPADLYNLECTTGLLMGDCWWGTDLCNLECTTGLLIGDCWWGTDLCNLECTTGLLMGDCWWGTDLYNLECTTGLLMGDCWWGTGGSDVLSKGKK